MDNQDSEIKQKYAYKLWKIFPSVLVITTIMLFFIVFQKLGLTAFLILVITIFTWPINNLIFGRFISDKFPEELPLIKSGWVNYPFVRGVFLIKSTVFPSGLGIELFPTVKFFIKLEDILELKEGFFGGNTLKHKSQGIFSPVSYLSNDVFEELQKLTSSRQAQLSNQPQNSV